MRAPNSNPAHILVEMANQVHAAAEVGATVTLQCFTYNFTVLQLDCEKGTCFQWYKVRVLAKNFAMMASADDVTMVTESESYGYSPG